MLGCSGQAAPLPQWKVYLATDAPVPQLGEVVYVEVIDGQGHDVPPVDEHTRLIDGSRPELWPTSFGVVPSSPTETARLRVRLYRPDQIGADGTPQGTLLIDATATLPPVASGVSRVAITLAMSCFGVAPDLAGGQTCDPSTGSLAPEPSLVGDVDLSTLPAAGSWPPAKALPCTAPVPDGMACIPGGVFLMGAARYFPLDPAEDPSPQHLVQLHPFAIDLQEVTVADIKALVRSGGLPPPLQGDPMGATPPGCTYEGLADPTNDGMPVNCVTWSQASQACALLQKRLPTEAEWEYVASNVGAGTPYPWGSDPDPCTYAVVGRGRPLVHTPESTECLNSSFGFASGPAAGGDARDVTFLGVMNLGGNMGEWVADAFEPYSSPCWSAGGLLVDPVCTATSAAPVQRSVRGGSWGSSPLQALAYNRFFASESEVSVGAGFRCALDMP
jgi:formylglycine-generating enzyme required for sulfatase activity